MKAAAWHWLLPRWGRGPFLPYYARWHRPCSSLGSDFNILMIIFCCCGSRCSNPSRHPNYTTTTTYTIRCHVLCWLLPQYNFNGENITILALIKKIDISEKNPLAPISSHSFHLVWHLLFDEFIYPRIKCTFAAAHNLWWSVLGEWIWCDLVSLLQQS